MFPSYLELSRFEQKICRLDDINMAVQATRSRLRYENGQSYIDTPLIVEEEKIRRDERTMKFIKQVGNDIHPSIQLEVDYPSNHDGDSKLPILDMKVWVETAKRQCEVEGVQNEIAVIVYTSSTRRS